MCRRIVVVILLFLLLPVVHAAAAVDQKQIQIFSMDISPGEGSTVINFALSAEPVGTVKYDPDQKKLILRFINTKYGASEGTRFGNANITSFSSQELPDNSAVFYFDTTGEVTWKIDFNSTCKRMRFVIISKALPPSAQMQSSTGESKVWRDLRLKME